MEVVKLLVLMTLYSLVEVRFDKKITAVTDIDGVRTKLENKLPHKDQNELRALFIFICVAWVCTEYQFWHVVQLTGFAALFMWIGVDIIAAKWWLNQPWWYIGKSSKTDLFLKDPVVNWATKLVFLLLLLYFYL